MCNAFHRRETCPGSSSSRCVDRLLDCVAPLLQTRDIPEMPWEADGAPALKKQGLRRYAAEVPAQRTCWASRIVPSARASPGRVAACQRARTARTVEEKSVQQAERDELLDGSRLTVPSRRGARQTTVNRPATQTKPPEKARPIPRSRGPRRLSKPLARLTQIWHSAGDDSTLAESYTESCRSITPPTVCRQWGRRW